MMRPKKGRGLTYLRVICVTNELVKLSATPCIISRTASHATGLSTEPRSATRVDTAQQTEVAMPWSISSIARANAGSTASSDRGTEMLLGDSTEREPHPISAKRMMEPLVMSRSRWPTRAAPTRPGRRYLGYQGLESERGKGVLV